MKTYTTKIAKNGATLYYSTETGKRIAKETALENERNYLLANAEEITAEVDDEEIVDEIDDEEEVSEELDTEDSVDEIDEDAEDDDENEVNENDVTEELNEDRRALETINPEEIVAIATVKMNIAEDEMKLAEAEVNKAYNAIGRLNEKSSDEKRKAAYARADAADVAYDAACQAYQASRKNLEAAYEVANEIRYANIKAEETTEATEQVAEIKTETKKTCKNYSLNPVIDEDSTLKLNHLNIFISGTTLKVGGMFECKHLETAYRRFTKIMGTASREIPELKGWGNNIWLSVKKFTENEFGWENEDGDIVLYHKDGENTLAVDINEDYFYIWGNFPDAFEVTEQVAEVNTVEEKPEVSEYKPQTSWENPHEYETVGDLDTERYLAARNHFTTVEELLPELGELKTEIDATNDKYLLAGIGLLICNHFDLDEARKVFGLILSEYRAEAEATEDDVKKLYNVCAQINFDKTFEHLPEFEYIRDGIKEETLDKAHDIFRAIRYNLGDQALASELTKLADEFGIDRALLLQSDDCRFNPALFEEKSAEPAPEPTGKMKWAAELLDNYTYKFEGDWEAGNGGLARHYKRFNRDGEQVGKLVEVFTDKTSFILDHVNIVDKNIRTYYYINGETHSYFKGKFNFIWSDKYKAGVSVVGGEHLQVEVPDGQWKKYKNFMVGDDEFFQIMAERSACSFEPEILNADIWVNINHSPQQDCAFVTIGTDDLYFEGVKLVSILNDAYDFRLKFTPSGRKQFSYRGEIISAKKVADIYMSQLAAKEADGELKLPFVDSFTVKRAATKDSTSRPKAPKTRRAKITKSQANQSRTAG